MALAARIAAAHPPGPAEGGVLLCPRCAAPFVDYDACAALTCPACGAFFCAVCLAESRTEAAAHDHVQATHSDLAMGGVGGFFVSLEAFRAHHSAQETRGWSRPRAASSARPRWCARSS